MEPSILVNRPEIQSLSLFRDFEHCASGTAHPWLICFPAQGVLRPLELDSLKPQSGHSVLSSQVWLRLSRAVLSNSKAKLNRSSMKYGKEYNEDAFLISVGQVILPWVTYCSFILGPVAYSLCACSLSLFLSPSPSLYPLRLSPFPVFNLFLPFCSAWWVPIFPFLYHCHFLLLATVCFTSCLFVLSPCSVLLPSAPRTLPILHFLLHLFSIICMGQGTELRCANLCSAVCISREISIGIVVTAYSRSYSHTGKTSPALYSGSKVYQIKHLSKLCEMSFWNKLDPHRFHPNLLKSINP